MIGYMYILKCFNDLYYTGSTNNLEKRLSEHQSGNGANFTKKNLPVELVYYEEYQRIDEAFYREKQVQGWSRKKKEALINGNQKDLPKLAKKIFSKSSLSSIQLPCNHSESDENRALSVSDEGRNVSKQPLLSSIQLPGNHSESDENRALSVSDEGRNVSKQPHKKNLIIIPMPPSTIKSGRNIINEKKLSEFGFLGLIDYKIKEIK